jgi:uncharacterized membrane protein
VTDRGLRRAGLVLAILGIGIAGYLTYVHYANVDPVCNIAHGCHKAQTSSYARLAGVPVALLGLLGYLAILGSLAGDGERARTLTAVLAFAGFGLSAWLTWIEVGELHAICTWCVGSALCMTALAGLSAVRLA